MDDRRLLDVTRPGWDRPHIVIVGGGPVGLTLAIELGLRDVAVTLIEARDGSVAVPKMTQLTARTLEFCRRWGIADRVIAAGWPKQHPMDFLYVTAMTGFEIYRRARPSYVERPHESFSPTLHYQCPQIFFDPILRDFAATVGPVSLRYMTQLESYEIQGDELAVTARDATTGEPRTMRCRFLVGCDGAQSTVRSLAGIEMSGEGHLDHSLSIFFRSSALAAIHDKGWARFYRLVDRGGHWADLVAIDGGNLWRLTILKDFDPSRPFGSDEADAAIVRAVGVPVAYEILSILPWERRELVADRYRNGPIFLAGDAAHQNSPTGGLGMNTGVADAVDLGWKLAAVTQGWGGEALLDSYEIERRPVAVTNVRECSRIFRDTIELPVGDEIGQDGPPGQALRDAVAAQLRATVRDGTISVSENTRTGYCYDGSPVIWADGTHPVDEAARDFVPSARPGTRAPHAWIGAGRSLLDLYGDGFTLLQLGTAAPAADRFLAAAQSKQVPIRLVRLDSDEIARLYGAPLVLVRPDGHVAWRGTACPADPGKVIDVARGHRAYDAGRRAAAAAGVR